MLKNSFCCFKGLSASAERALWKAGCLSWQQMAIPNRILSERKRQIVCEQLPEMEAALQGGLSGYFLSRLPCGHRLRVWPAFSERTLFVDIETTGLSVKDEITVIGARWRGGILHFIRGQNLEDFLRIAGEAALVVSFNGIRFDWPLIERAFGCRLPVPHIDLMHEAKAHGYAGGLKRIEQRTGIVRAPEEEGDGLQAVLFWRNYIQTGNQEALRQLLSYNACDVQSLYVLSRKFLMLSMDGFPGPRPAIP